MKLAALEELLNAADVASQHGASVTYPPDAWRAILRAARVGIAACNDQMTAQELLPGRVKAIENA